MNLLKIDWLGCDYCINVGYAEVTTESNDTKWLWSGDEVKCPECGISGIIEVEEGVAFCVWDKPPKE